MKEKENSIKPPRPPSNISEKEHEVSSESSSEIMSLVETEGVNKATFINKSLYGKGSFKVTLDVVPFDGQKEETNETVK
jgi:hypothetical protein